MRFCLVTLGQAGLVDDGGAPVEFPVGKPFGILAYLSLATEPVPRDDLAAVFWDRDDRSRARHSLRQALSFLRQRLGEDIFASDDPVALDRSVVESDVELLREALGEGDTNRVLELYQGPFLETFQLPDSPAWDHWVEIQRRVLEERVASALREDAERVESPGRAVELLRRVVAIEPHRVQHRMALLDRLLAQGDLDAATTVLAEARQAELGDPEAVGAMESRLRRVRESRMTGAADASELRPEFVGRSAELASLTALWRQATRGSRQVAILTGPVGIGKTRLAEELAGVARTTGRSVHVKASLMERRLDWSVTAELARALYRLPGAAGVASGAENVLRSLIPTLGGSATPSPTIAPRPVAVSDALVDLASAVAYEAPLLIVLDDMQWVDRASLALLMRMTRQLQDEPVMVVFTFRSEALSGPDQVAIDTLVEQEGASVIRLHTLTEAEIEEMLTLSGIQEPPDRIEDLAARLHDVTRGHPLFLVELLRSLRDDGVLVAGGDGWRLRGDGPIELELPVSVRLAIDKRLEKLSDAARQVGAELAGLPPNTELQRVRGRTGLSDASFTTAVSELLERAVVTWDPAGRLVFTHDQLREAMTKGNRRPYWRYATAAAAVLVVSVVAALAVWGQTVPKPWGGGVIVAMVEDSIVVIDPDGPSERGETVPETLWAPDVGGGVGLIPKRLADGRLVWYGERRGVLDPPDGAVHWGPDSVTVLGWPGDDNVKDVSPDGSRILWVTQHHDGDRYAKELRLTSVGSEESHLLTGPASDVSARWSPDGERIAVDVNLARDSLLVLSSSGERLFTRDYYRADLEGWCGVDRMLWTVQRGPTDPYELILLNEAGTETVVDTVAIADARCSPDGSAYVSRIFEGGVLRAAITEIGTGDRQLLPSTVAGARDLYWVPDSIPPVAEALIADQDTIRLTRGATAALRGRLRMTDGTFEPAAARWRSTDPGIASVLADTTLAANRAGSVRVIGEYASWLRDTVFVQVVEGERDPLILADDFRSLDTRRWFIVGHPPPGTVRVDGRTVLELRGDGRYADGIISHEARVTPAGVTMELEFRAPQTRPEYQDFTVWVGRASPPEDPEAADQRNAWIFGDNISFMLPAFELAKWDPEIVAFRSSVGSEAVRPLPDGTDPARWTRLAIQVQADGLATLWIDHQQVARVQVPITLLREPLRVGIFADAVDTYAYVRDFTWWSEPRYR